VWAVSAALLAGDAAVLLPAAARAQEVPFRTGTWDPDTLGNHRAVLRVRAAAPAVRAHIPWRRRDAHPESRRVRIVARATGRGVRNVVRGRITRAAGELAFEPTAGPGTYYVYYLPHTSSGRSNYPKVVYPPPVETADAGWRTAAGLRPGRSGPDDPAWARLP